jgi:hypothetical protein
VALRSTSIVARRVLFFTRSLACFLSRRFCLALSPLILDISSPGKASGQNGNKAMLPRVRSGYAATIAAAVSLCEVELTTFDMRTFGGSTRNLSRVFNTAGYVLVL